VSDDRLRELERRFEASGAFDDQVALLRERLRAGQADRARLSLAATCGHPAARALQLGEVGDHYVVRFLIDPPSRSESYVNARNVESLASWGKPAAVRVALAAARLLLPVWEKQVREPAPRWALKRVVEWLHDPCESRAEAARVAGEAVRGRLLQLSNAGDPFAQQAAQATEAAALVAAAPGPLSAARGALGVARAAEHVVGKPELGIAVCAELMAWALEAENAAPDR